MTDLMGIYVKSCYIVLSGDAFENYFIVCVQLSGFFIIYYFIFLLLMKLVNLCPYYRYIFFMNTFAWLTEHSDVEPANRHRV